MRAIWPGSPGLAMGAGAASPGLGAWLGRVWLGRVAARLAERQDGLC